MVCAPVASHAHTCIILVLAWLTCYSVLASVSRGKIGVDYGLNGDNLLPPEETVELLCSRGITRVRIYDARPDVIQAFANSGIDLMIGVPNEEVPKLAANLGEAFNWVTKYVVPFPRSGISAILVGNEWLHYPSNDPSVLVPAMQNIYNALSTLQFFYIYLSRIKVSTSHAFDVLNNTFPPSTATIAEPFVPVMRSLLDFLDDSGSFFMVNIFPYFTYLADEGVSLEFALFESTEVVTDPNTRLNYTNLFDLQLDAAYTAMASLSSSSSPASSSPPCASNSSEVEKASNEHVHASKARNHDRSPPPPKPPGMVGETGWSSKGHSSDTPPNGVRAQFLPSRHSISALSSTQVTSSMTSSLSSSISALSSTQVTSSSSSSMTSSLSHASNNSNINDHFSSSSPSSSTTIEEKQLLRAPYAQEHGHCECDTATVENARTYNQNLIRHVLRAKGTPANPNTPIRAYIFSIFNENLKLPEAEQHFGLFFPNGTAVYPINFNDQGK